ncbi:MAG TPA: hypothetical protein VIX59_00480 [Candidatus Binataceae bacterium]
MDRAYFKALGSGFGVFGFGLNVVLRVAPMIGWQPSYITALVLLILAFICMAGGTFMVLVTVIPSNATVYTIFARYKKPIVLWIFAMLAFAFLSWQSITIFHLNADEARREAQEWPALDSTTIENLATELSMAGPHKYEILSCSSRDCDVFADGIRAAFYKAKWTPIAEIPINRMQMAWKMPPGWVISGYGDPAGLAGLKQAIKTVLHADVPALNYSMNSRKEIDRYVSFKIGEKPSDFRLSAAR